MTPQVAQTSAVAEVRGSAQSIVAQQTLFGPDRAGDGDRLVRLIGDHLGRHPGEALMLLAPGLSVRPETVTMLQALLAEARAGDAYTVLSNADPDLNPFADVDIGALAETDLTALVALLGPGEVHALHRLPSHLLLLPAATLELIAKGEGEFAGALDGPLEAGGRLLVPDRIFVHDPSAPLNSAPHLEPHEQPRPVPWGFLNRRLDDWLSDPAWLKAAAGTVESFSARALAGDEVCLHVTHSWGGGVARWVDSFIDADASCLHLQLRSEGPKSGDGAGQRLALYAGTLTGHPLASWWLEPVIASTAPEHPQYREILKYIEARYGVSRVIVSSLVGHSLDALRLDRPTLEVLHDFYPAWPLLGIHPQAYLGDRGADLVKAMREHDVLPDFRGRSARAWRTLGRRWLQTIEERQVRLVAPSRSVAGLLPRLDRKFSGLDPLVIPHGLADGWVDADWEARPRADGRLRLLVPGRIQQGKGKALLLRALPELRRHARIILLGCGKEGEDFFGLRDVDVVINYRRQELPELIARIAPDAAALLSTVPETFSYMLSEMRQLGVPVIATRVGSFAERIEDGSDGWLIEPQSAALVEKSAWLAENRERLTAMRRAVRARPQRTAADMVGDYHALFSDQAEAQAPVQPPVQLPVFSLEYPGASQAGPLASLSTRQRRAFAKLERRLAESQAEIEERTEWARERDRILKQEQEKAAKWVDRVEKTLEREIDAHKYTREQLEDVSAQHESVLASSSWKITRPLRAARRLGGNFVRARAWNPLRWPLLLAQLTRTVVTLGWRDAVMRMQTTQATQSPGGLKASEFEPIGDPDPPAVMPRADHPLVSIVIPVHNQWVYTAACLRSIAETECKAGFEVIVIDDASTDETAERLARIKGLDAVSNRKNLGFIGSCNRGSALARGDFIVLLNNDTQVLDGWLDRLLRTFRRFPDTGIAGARLVYPDGRLQECGGVVFSDGSGWNYGRGDNPDRPDYLFVREVDYCSGACIMLRHDVFKELGGFDEAFAPAYYEDTDIAFRVRELGLKVRVQPAATVVHHEGISSGTDIDSGIKRYQAVNRVTFLKRWETQLAAHPRPIVNPDDRGQLRAARDHRVKGRVLIIDAYTPEPDQDSGSLRLRYLMDCFFELGYGVSFIPDNRSYVRRYTEELQQSGVEAWCQPWLDSLHSWFSEHGAQFDYVMVCRHYVAANYIGLIRRYCPKAKFIFDTIDLHYLREERLAELEDSLPLRRSAAQTRRSELAVIREADATLVVSPAEAAILEKDAPGEAVHLLSNIHRVVGSQNPFEARKDIFFVGGFQHPPNIDAALWFCSSVWPLIQEKLPELKFHLIGSKAPDQLKALHGGGVVFHGYVPRLEPFLDGCRLAVAPLRYGAGVKGKVNLSMSRGQPVVATPAAVEGLFAHDGEDVVVASEPQEFADAVVRLYNDEALWNKLSTNGLANVEKFFSIDTARRNLQTVLDSFQ